MNLASTLWNQQIHTTRMNHSCCIIIFFWQLDSSNMDRYGLTCSYHTCVPFHGAEYLGFLNRTCSPALSSTFTSGPVIRGSSKSMMWREWMVRVANVSSEKGVTVSLQAYMDPNGKNKANCLGYVTNFYGNPNYMDTCDISPYGDGLFLNATSDEGDISPQKWTVIQGEGDSEKGMFQLIASNKPSECLRYLGLKGCKSSVVLVGDTSIPVSNSPTYTAWHLIRRYDLVPVASPPPPPPRPSPPSTFSNPQMSTGIPGPVISAPSRTSSGYADVTVTSLGGSDACAVRSIVITATGSSIGSVPVNVEVSASQSGQTVSVPLNVAGYNRIYAVGQCDTGEMTEISNGLSVFYVQTGCVSNSIPGEPTNFKQLNSTGERINGLMSFSWDDSASNECETYSIKCMELGSSCDSTPIAIKTGISRGQTDVTVDGLQPSTLYTCYVVGENGIGTTCSEPVKASYNTPGTCDSNELSSFKRQTPRCSTPSPTEAQVQASAATLESCYGSQSVATGQGAFVSSTFSAVVPIFFYVCVDNPQEIVPDSRLQAQMKTLNEGYANSGTGIAFTYAGRMDCNQTQLDEWNENLGEGNPEEDGTSYLLSLALELEMDAIVVATGTWQPAGDPFTLLGQAMTGIGFEGGQAYYQDPVKYPLTFIGDTTINGGGGPVGQGATLVHEVGHNLGLYHTFNMYRTYNEELACYPNSEGEQVSFIKDTPTGWATAIGSEFQGGCQVSVATCGEPHNDPVNNFMSYSDDCCLLAFSPEQALTMQCELNTFKPEWVITK